MKEYTVVSAPLIPKVIEDKKLYIIVSSKLLIFKWNGKLIKLKYHDYGTISRIDNFYFSISNKRARIYESVN